MDRSQRNSTYLPLLQFCDLTLQGEDLIVQALELGVQLGVVLSDLLSVDLYKQILSSLHEVRMLEFPALGSCLVVGGRVPTDLPEAVKVQLTNEAVEFASFKILAHNRLREKLGIGDYEGVAILAPGDDIVGLILKDIIQLIQK